VLIDSVLFTAGRSCSTSCSSVYLAAAVRPGFAGKDPVRGVTGYSRRR
jgi:hypothetical protein